MKLPRIEVFSRSVTGWYWRLVASNGETMCVSEEFTRKDDAERSAKRARMLMCIARVVTEEG